MENGEKIEIAENITEPKADDAANLGSMTTDDSEVASESGAEARECDAETTQLFSEDGEELDAINRICNCEYPSLEAVPNYNRYKQLRGRGDITVEEAFYAVNHGELPRLRTSVREKEVLSEDGEGFSEDGAVNGRHGANATFGAFDTRGHLSSSRNKGSAGEVFTRADREEMELWGITATGAELERLWRAANRM